MSEGQTLRVLVNARLTAAAEEIFALFERTIAEFEEELRRCKEENQRKQERLDCVLSQGLDHQDLFLNQALNQTLDQEITDAWIKAEPEEQQRVKQEEDLLQVPVPESSSVRVKREGSSLLQQTEPREEPRPEDTGTEPLLPPQTEGKSSNTHDDDDWRAPFSCSGAQTETETDGSRSEPETSANTRGTAEETQHKCSVCKKTFQNKDYLKVHSRVHTGERPYSCPVCAKTFSQMSHLKSHTRTHTGDRPFSCSVCGKTFSQTSHLKAHSRTHTGDRPFSCAVCGKRFVVGSTLKLHMGSHTGDQAFGCSVCGKRFVIGSRLKLHMRTHTGDRPFGCAVCGKAFSQRSHLKRHLKTHRATELAAQHQSACGRGGTSDFRGATDGRVLKSM